MIDEIFVFNINQNSRRLSLVKQKQMDFQVQDVRSVETNYDTLLIVAKQNCLMIMKGTKLHVIKEIELRPEIGYVQYKSLNWIQFAKSKQRINIILSKSAGSINLYQLPLNNFY